MAPGAHSRPRLPATYVAKSPSKTTYEALSAIWLLLGIALGLSLARSLPESPLAAMWLGLLWLGGAGYLGSRLDAQLGRIRITERGVRRIGLWPHEDVPWESLGTVSVCAHDQGAALLSEFSAGALPAGRFAGGAAARVATALARGAPTAVPTVELRSRRGHIILEVARATFGWPAIRALCAEAEARGIQVVVY